MRDVGMAAQYEYHRLAGESVAGGPVDVASRI
jgi:hypothetical protein